MHDRSLTEMYGLHAQNVYRHVRPLASVPLAEQITIDVFVAAVRTLRTQNIRPSLDALLKDARRRLAHHYASSGASVSLAMSLDLSGMMGHVVDCARGRAGR